MSNVNCYRVAALAIVILYLFDWRTLVAALIIGPIFAVLIGMSARKYGR